MTLWDADSSRLKFQIILVLTSRGCTWRGEGMFKKLVAPTISLLFVFQTICSSYPAFANNAPSEDVSKTYEEHAKADLVLDRNNISAKFLGVEIRLISPPLDGSAVKATVKCFGSEATPPLAIDANIYGEKARLLNSTAKSQRDCNSYEIIVAENIPGDSDNSNVLVGRPIAVSVASELRTGVDEPTSVFVFNPVQGNWTSPQSYKPVNPTPNKAYATLTEQHQRVISGMIVNPDNSATPPTENSAASVADPLSGLNPDDGYLSLGELVPDSKGTLSKSLPLLLRPSRGPKPSFSIDYSSNATAGVLGRGWDLNFSSISARGPNPIYHPDFETEDYVLDGQDLIALDATGQDIPSLYKGGPIIKRIKDVRLFRLRNNSQGLIVRRFGDNPKSYHWLVWNPHTGVTRLYGGHRPESPTRDQAGFERPEFNADGNGILFGNVHFDGGRSSLASSRTIIGQWALTQEYDNQPAKNGVSYFYNLIAKTCDSSWGNSGSCSPSLRLDEVVYNLSFANALSKVATIGVTRVHFDWIKRDDERFGSDGIKRFNSDGRLGFLRANEYWLNFIEVKYPKEGGLLNVASISPTNNPERFTETFSKHSFELTFNDPCTSYEALLSSYTVSGNSSYDLDTNTELKEQKFTFEYQGQGPGHCKNAWDGPQDIDLANTSEELKKSPVTSLGFPSELLNNLGFRALTDVSLLGSSQSSEIGSGIYIGVGPLDDVTRKPTSVGVKVGSFQAKSETGSTLIDITGDGISDIVYKVGSSIRYCAGKRTGAEVSYPSGECGSVDIGEMVDLGKSSTSGESIGFEAYAGNAFVGIGTTEAQNQTYVYFTDRDGDGLSDLVAYGRVYYGLGKDANSHNVRFATNKSLTPPLPGNDDRLLLEKRVPQDLNAEVDAAARRLEATTAKLERLDYSQSTISWEAPFDGRVNLAGSLLIERSVSETEKNAAGTYDPGKLGPQDIDFPSLDERADALREYFYECQKRPFNKQCYATVEDPYGSHYVRPEGTIDFVDTPAAYVHVALSKKSDPKTSIECANGTLELGQPKVLDTLLYAKDCNEQIEPVGSEIYVHTGDVIYLTYSIAPDTKVNIIPKATISYKWVENDAAFNFTTGAQDDEISGLLNCGWLDQGKRDFREKCFLQTQTRYTYDITTATLPSAPGQEVLLRQGSQRTFGGKFEIQTALTKDYSVYFDVFAVETTNEIASSSEFPRLLRQDISRYCESVSSESCVVDIQPSCFGSPPDCDAFFGTDGHAVRLTARLTIEHKSLPGLTATNLNARLTRLQWRVPPFVSSYLTETKGPQSEIPSRPKEDDLEPQLVKVYLPFTMGDDDKEYGRVNNGLFPNPNPDLNEASSTKSEVNFDEILSAEGDNVAVTRNRQTQRLCGFATEIIDFLEARDTTYASPYGVDYSAYWRARQVEFQPRCREAEQALYELSFTSDEDPNKYLPRLNLPRLLRNLSVAQQTSSAETLLDRVLKNLALPSEILTDDFKLTRRGYRLPAKVNPLDCNMLTPTAEPIDEPIFGEEGRCRFRMLSNFAMADLQKLVGQKNGKALTDFLAQLYNNPSVAFSLELTATVNGNPVLFQELSGADEAGNLPCTAPKNTCLGHYGSFDRLEQHLYPDLMGDMFQRIVTNRRAGRAVAFSDDVMRIPSIGVCVAGRRYQNDVEMEAKQDCPQADVSAPDYRKYAGPKTARILYEILENNRFKGRNRVIEFEAGPLDILELHFSLKPVGNEATVQGPNGPAKISGNFSVFDVDQQMAALYRIKTGKYLVPRSPYDLLAPDSISPACPQKPIFFGTDTDVPSTCRPWSKLGWTEVLLGAEYRTLSDAHRTSDKFSYSVQRRRELLRIQPEIEVPASSYYLNVKSKIPTADEVYQESIQTIAGTAIDKGLEVSSHPIKSRETSVWPSTLSVMSSRNPNVSKIGADWGLFAQRHFKDGKIVLPPSSFDLRYNSELLGAAEKTQPDVEGAIDVCGNHSGQPSAKAYYKCKVAIAEYAAEQPSFDDIRLIPLVHRFVGPITELPDSTNEDVSELEHVSQVSPCIELPARRTAGCWKGQDDTIFAERGIQASASDLLPFHSISALVGFEHQPISRFTEQFDTLCRLLLSGPEKDTVPNEACPRNQIDMGTGADTLAETLELGAFPNRPDTPSADRVIEVFAPIQSSESETMSLVAGVEFVNANKSWTEKSTRQLFLDVNGDGYPDSVTNGVADLTSPVGLSRRDWWRYFRIEPDALGLSSEASMADLEQSSDSSNVGVGAGLSPSTFAKSEPKGSKSHAFTGSPNAAVEPSFDLSFEQGQDDRFTDLRDFNGDGLTDTIEAREVSSSLSVALNAGSHLTPALPRGGPVVTSLSDIAFEDKFNTSHGAGFGVRLGYSYASGSFTAGMGLSHKDSSSEGTLMDFNGDGRVDVVLPVTRNGKSFLAVFPNLGNGFSNGRLYEITGWENSETGATETTFVDAGASFTWGIPIPLIGIKIVFNPNTKKTNGQTRELLQIRDMDADGAPDIVTVSGRFKSASETGVPTLQLSSLKTKLHHNPDARYYLLRSISEPSGKRHFLSFGLFGNTGPEHGSSVWALTSVATFDGYEPTQVADSIRLSADGQDIDLTLYDYAQGYYNRAERQFYGFARRIVRKFGCDIGADHTPAGRRCAQIIASGKTLTQSELVDTAFNELLVSIQTYSNLDYLTQGILLSQTALGFSSSAKSVTPALKEDVAAADLVSQSLMGYTIDNLSTLPRNDDDAAPTKLEVTSSKLPEIWDGTKFVSNGAVLGPEGLCKDPAGSTDDGYNVKSCARNLERKMFNDGFVREQTTFWDQEPGAVRQRFELLQTPGGNEQIQGFENTDRVPQLKKTPKLTSAIAFEHDQWGQVISFASLGETLRDGTPVERSATQAEITYANRQGPNSKLGTPDESVAVGYPLLDLPDSIRIYPGFVRSTIGDASPSLRAREAIYANDGTANLTDVCSYPGGEGFQFDRKTKICHAFKSQVAAALQDGYGTAASALRDAYAKIPGLPKGVDQFDAVIHEQIAGYDPYGNITQVVSPFNSNKEWLERRFDYSSDPFLTSPTTIEATRCVEDVPGAGTDSAGLVKSNKSRCTYGLKSLNSAVERKVVTHYSRSRIDPAFGMVAETQDINGNSLLFDHDRWGRLRLIARSWGNEPRENSTYKPWLDVAAKKTIGLSDTDELAPGKQNWRILAITDFGRKAYTGNGFENTILRSSIRRFEASANYNGLLPQQNTTRETAIISDAAGRVVQAIQEADVCLGALGTILDGINPGPKEDLASRCTAVATGYVTPGPATDVLGREWQTFEPYAISDTSGIQSSKIRFEDLQYRTEEPRYVTDTLFDAASRPLRAENRLSATLDTTDGKRLRATAQYSYRVLDERLLSGQITRGPRFEALSLTPRCTAGATWSDARGLTTDVFEGQRDFYGEQPDFAALKDATTRDYEKSLAKCWSLERLSPQWAADALASETAKDVQPARVSYEYDQLRQLLSVDSPLEGDNRSAIYAIYDQLGRMTEMREPNAGCVRYHFDGLQNLTSEIASKYQPNEQKSCDAASKVKNEKLYRYSADRLLEMSYRSLEEQGGAKDQADKVRFFYDRFPYASTHGELIEALRFVPNDLANQRFVDQTALECENCIGKVAIVADRSGATSQTYNELGLPLRQIRSIVGPIRNSVKRSDGKSETVLPELAFYELRNAYTSFGDLVEQRFNERAPMNPSFECLQAGVETCLAHFTLGRKYGPDGSIAQLLYNGTPLVSAAFDPLRRPAVRWTADGTVTGFEYDRYDLRMNRLATITAGIDESRFVPIQRNGYQYDGGGNVLSYRNIAEPKEHYSNWFGFSYDPANRLSAFAATVQKSEAQLFASAAYTYDAGHRFKTRELTITGDPGSTFKRSWTYKYDAKPGAGPLHAPSEIAFSVNNVAPRSSLFTYDDIGQMSRITANENARESSPAVVTNRRMSWDAQGRMLSARGVEDSSPENAEAMREDYIYDYAGNRILKFRPAVGSELQSSACQKRVWNHAGCEVATIYMTPFYARGLDGHGAVQITEGTLPTATLSPPADESEAPLVTYFYSDLVVGSTTAGVTSYGEVEDAQSTLIGRREYSPFGLELTVNELAITRRADTAPISVFHGKELDNATKLSSFGARYYSRDLGLWISTDPLLPDYLVTSANSGTLSGASRLASYSFALNNPIGNRDSDGRWVGFDDALAVGGGVVLGLVAQGGADLYQGNLSNWRSYAASAVGGGLGAWAGLYAGPAVGLTANVFLKGAIAGTISGTVSGGTTYASGELMNGRIPSGSGVVTAGAFGGLTGGVFGGTAAWATNLLSNSAKGKFGEFLTRNYLRLRGETIVDEQALIRIGDKSSRSIRPDFRLGDSRFADAKFGYHADFTKNQKLFRALGGDLEGIFWTPDSVSKPLGAFWGTFGEDLVNDQP